MIFNDINWFINDDEPYDINIAKKCINIKEFNVKYSSKIGDITIYRVALFNNKTGELNINSDIEFRIEFNKNVSYYELKKIYGFRNFLLILGRRYIDFEKIQINNNNLYDYYEEYNYNPLNKEYTEYLNDHTITLSLIENFGAVISKYMDNYEKMISVIDAYFCSVKYALPTKVKFINACTMIEDYTNIFLISEAKKYKKVEANKNKQKFISQLTNKMLDQNIINESKIDNLINLLEDELKKDSVLSFKEKVISVIANVNESFKLNDNEIDIIANNFREARKQFVHNGMIVNSKDYIILEKYCSFAEDIIYLNILKIVGVDISDSIFDCIEYSYEKDDLKVKFK